MKATTHNCILTFDNGERVKATLTAPKGKFRFPKQLVQELAEQFNKQYPHRTHRVTGVHLMRN